MALIGGLGTGRAMVLLELGRRWEEVLGWRSSFWGLES